MNNGINYQPQLVSRMLTGTCSSSNFLPDNFCITRPAVAVDLFSKWIHRPNPNLSVSRCDAKLYHFFSICTTLTWSKIIQKSLFKFFSAFFLSPGLYAQPSHLPYSNFHILPTACHVCITDFSGRLLPINGIVLQTASAWKSHLKPRLHRIWVSETKGKCATGILL